MKLAAVAPQNINPHATGLTATYTPRGLSRVSASPIASPHWQPGHPAPMRSHVLTFDPTRTLASAVSPVKLKAATEEPDLFFDLGTLISAQSRDTQDQIKHSSWWLNTKLRVYTGLLSLRRRFENAATSSLKTFEKNLTRLLPTTAVPKTPALETQFPKIPGYQILEELNLNTEGRPLGGQGRIFLATSEQGPYKTVVVKTLKAGSDADTWTRSLFRREAKLLEQLEHDHIITLLEAGEHEGRDYMVLEHASGGDLVKYYRSHIGALPIVDREQEVAEILVQALSGLITMHNRGIIHNDIKPSNILLTDGPQRKSMLIDLGAAEHIANPTLQNSATVFIGTASYADPDRYFSHSNSFKSDIFSMGVSLYSLVTGKKPWPIQPGQSVDEIMRQIAGTHPLDPQEAAPELSEGMAAIIRRAISLDSDRYPSGIHFREDLLRFLDQSTTQRMVAV